MLCAKIQYKSAACMQVWVGLAPDGLEQSDEQWVPPTPQLQRRLTDGSQPDEPLPSLVTGSR